jgi:hypothetical protein
MSATPQPQRVILEGNPEVHVKGVPSLLQMVLSLFGTAILIITAILGGEHLLITKSLQTLDAQMSERETKSDASIREAIRKSVATLNEDQLRTRGVVRRLLTASTLPQNEKNDLGNDLALGTVKTVLNNKPKNAHRRSVETLLRNKQIEKREVTKFTWNEGKNEGQIRYFELLDAALDLSQIDLYSEGDKDHCDSVVLTLPVVDAVVEACQTHLDSKGRLELIVVRNSE